MDPQLTTAAGTSVPGNQEQNLSSESKCPFSNGARRHAASGGPTNASWWPNQLNLKILQQHSAPVLPCGQGVQLCEGIQEPRPGCRDKGPACRDDGIAGLVARGLWPLWAALHPYGVA